MKFFASQERHVAPMGVKFGMEEGSVPNFTPIGATIRYRTPKTEIFTDRIN